MLRRLLASSGGEHDGEHDGEHNGGYWWQGEGDSFAFVEAMTILCLVALALAFEHLFYAAQAAVKRAARAARGAAVHPGAHYLRLYRRGTLEFTVLGASIQRLSATLPPQETRILSVCICALAGSHHHARPIDDPSLRAWDTHTHARTHRHRHARARTYTGACTLVYLSLSGLSARADVK